jgi:hypothetical protein
VAALALTSLALAGAATVAAPAPAQAAPACAAGWEVYEGSWHLASGWPGALSVTCDGAGAADWAWQTPFGGPQHYRQAVFFGMPYLEHWHADGTSVVIMQYGTDPNRLVLSSQNPQGGYSSYDLFRG